MRVCVCVRGLVSESECLRVCVCVCVCVQKRGSDKCECVWRKRGRAGDLEHNGSLCVKRGIKLTIS